MNAIKVAVITILLSAGIALSPHVLAQTNTQPGTNVQPKVVAILEGHLEADDLIKVEVDHLAEWVASNPANNPAKLVPYVDGLALRGNYPEEIHTSKNHLHYHLRITSESK